MKRNEANEPVASAVRLELPPQAVSIAVARAVIRRIVTFRDDDAQSSFLVAFTEIAANAIDEHERIGSAEPICVEVRSGSIDLVSVVDSGEGLKVESPLEPGPSAPKNASERGRGLALAYAFIDRMEIDSTTDGTTVRLPLTGLGLVR